MLVKEIFNYLVDNCDCDAFNERRYEVLEASIELDNLLAMKNKEIGENIHIPLPKDFQPCTDEDLCYD